MDTVMWEPCRAQEAGPLVPVTTWVDGAAVRLAEHEIVPLPDVAGLASRLLVSEMVAENFDQFVSEGDRLLTPFLDRPENETTAYSFWTRGGVFDAVFSTEILGAFRGAFVWPAGCLLALRAILRARTAMLLFSAFRRVVAVQSQQLSQLVFVGVKSIC
jgi:hypothetical protein